jgi:hypothetical protein
VMVLARAITVVVAGLLAGLLGAHATAYADACDAGGYTGAERVVTTPGPSGYNVTAVYGEGVYHVSRCDDDGDLIEGQTVAPISEPGGGVALVPSTYSTPRGTGSVLYGDPRDPRWARAWAAGGERVKDSVLPPPPGVDVEVPEELPGPPGRGAPLGRGAWPGAGAPPGRGSASARNGADAIVGGGVRAAQAGDACRNGAFVRFGALARWPSRRYSYRINGASFGGIAETRSSIVAGHRAWDNTRNDCGFGDQNNITTRYLGRTTRKASSNADGASVIDKGEVGNITRCGRSTVAVACSWLQPGPADRPFAENDQRYDDDYRFTNSGSLGGSYDYQHIATHESGHSIGLDHTSASRWLTMYPQAPSGSTIWRTLGLGDVLGMRNIYP